jgi:hypothetical protein
MRSGGRMRTTLLLCRALATLSALGVMSAAQSAVAQSSEPAPGISIGGAQLPSLRPSLPAAGLAAGAPGLPDAGAAIDRVAPGTHGAPPATPGAPGAAPQAALPAPPPSGWSEAEVRAAQVQCQRALAGLEAQYVFIPQVKSGACGTPAAIELSGFGKGLAISPPIIVSCDIAAALQTWMKSHVQPLAKRHLGAGIVQINTMSSYACRNRYGAKNAPLSQHAFANAIDIRGFVTAKGQLLDVEQHWGPTIKELAAYQAARPEIIAASAVPAHGAVGGAGMPGTAGHRGGPAQSGAIPPIVTAAIPATGQASGQAFGAGGGSWATTVAAGPALMPAAVDTAQRATSPALPPPAPKTAAALLKPTFPVVMPVAMKANAGEPSTVKIAATGQAAMMGAAPLQPGQPLDGRAHFFREIWQAACGPFTTVLGPEANRAHRNHFHIDLAQRKSGAFCQ